uniref:Uncharacterized protein n=1 Tax=Heterorhabditis bacteriophora TaxID=37862 RepID=A0A1I7X5F6_HETBA
MLQVSFDSAVPTLSYNFKSCTQCNHPPARTRSKKLAIAKKLLEDRPKVLRSGSFGITRAMWNIAPERTITPTSARRVVGLELGFCPYKIRRAHVNMQSIRTIDSNCVRQNFSDVRREVSKLEVWPSNPAGQNSMDFAI